MIVLNQARCKKCGDAPYSAHWHDFKWCTCRAIAVDGGQVYLRRIGTPDDYDDISIAMAGEHVEKCKSAVMDAMGSGRNALGITFAVIRALRDCGYNMNILDGEDDG